MRKLANCRVHFMQIFALESANFLNGWQQFWWTFHWIQKWLAPALPFRSQFWFHCVDWQLFFLNYSRIFIWNWKKKRTFLWVLPLPISIKKLIKIKHWHRWCICNASKPKTHRNVNDFMSALIFFSLATTKTLVDQRRTVSLLFSFKPSIKPNSLSTFHKTHSLCTVCRITLRFFSLYYYLLSIL